MTVLHSHKHCERSARWSHPMERGCFFTESCFDLKVSHSFAFFTHECNINSSILYNSYYSRTLYVSWQRRVCKYGMCVFPQLSSELRKQSAVWVLCARDSRIGCEEWSLPLSRIPAHLSPSAQSRPSQHFTPPQRHNLHRDAFVLETISLSLKLSLCDWQNISEGHDTPSLHRCTVETGATAIQSITAWTLHHCQHDLWGNWKREWNAFWMAGEERRGEERRGERRGEKMQ